MALAINSAGRTENDLSTDFEKADMQKALEHWNKCSLRKFTENGKLSNPLNKNFDRKELGKYSTGFQLYFKFIKWLAIFFGIASIPGSYLIYSNYKGQGYTQIRSPFDSLTLGNQPDYSNLTTVLYNEGYEAWRNEIQAVNTELMIQQYIDLAISLVLFMFYWSYRRSSIREEEEIDLDNCNVSDYAIEVSGIPSKEATEFEVATHFGLLFGSVNQCKFAHNYEGTMPYFADIAELKNEKTHHEAKIRAGLSKNTKKITYYEKRITKLQKYVANKLKSKFGEKIMSHSDYPAVKAFIIFNSSTVQYRALRVYARYQSISFYKTVFCCKRNSLPQKLKLFGKYNLKVKQADEPTNIKWENQDSGTFESIFRFLAVYLVVILCLLFTFGFIIASNVLSYSAQVGAACTSGSSASTSSSSSSSVNCYCASLSIDQILESSSLQSQCSSYLEARSIEIAMSIISGLCIAIINAVIKQIFIALARFQRYHTLSRESGATLIKYFFSLFLNTAIIPILANSDIYGFELSKNLVQLFVNDPSGLVDSTFPSDFDRNWYSQVGSKIMSPMLIAVFSPHLINLLMIPCKKRMMRRKAKSVVFQKDLDRIYTPPEFKISFCYSIAMNILFVSFTFSAGMPLLYISAFVSLVMIYYSEKYIVARFCRKPPGYDSAQNDLVTKSIPFAVLLHCCFAIWMYGCDTIFPYDPSNVTWTNITGGSYGFVGRVQRSFPHAVLASFALLTIIIDNFVWPVFSTFSKQVERDAQAKIEQRKYGTFRQEYKKLAELGIASYNMKVNPEYHDIIDAMQLNIKDDKDPENNEVDHSHDNTAQNITLQNASTHKILLDNKELPKMADTDLTPKPAVKTGINLADSPLLNPESDFRAPIIEDRNTLITTSKNESNWPDLKTDWPNLKI